MSIENSKLEAEYLYKIVILNKELSSVRAQLEESIEYCASILNELERVGKYKNTHHRVVAALKWYEEATGVELPKDFL